MSTIAPKTRNNTGHKSKESLIKSPKKVSPKSNTKNKDEEKNSSEKERVKMKIKSKEDKKNAKTDTTKKSLTKEDTNTEENAKTTKKSLKNINEQKDNKDEIKKKDTKGDSKKYESKSKDIKLKRQETLKKTLFLKKPEIINSNYIDLPDKPQKPNKYVHQVVQLDKENSQFDEEKFQALRNGSFSNNIIDSLRRIGVCLNKISISNLPQKHINKLLFILITSNNDAGSYNDAYLMALIHKKLGFKIVFLYNSNHDVFLQFLEYFLTNTINSLTLYYSGHDSESKIRNIGHGIKFIDKSYVSSQELGQFIAEKSNGKTYILVLSDCGCGGSIFDMKAAKESENKSVSDIVTFTAHKSQLTPDQKIMSQGLFTYYFCKLIRQFPTSSPKDMAKKLNQSLLRFNISYSYETSSSDNRISDDIIFEDADASFNGPKAEITGPSKRKKVAPPKKMVEDIPPEFQT